MTKQNSKKLSEEMADHFAEKIIQMELAPGSRITEAMITNEWDASRIPAREALYILEKRNLVDLIPRKGARVKDLTIEDVTSHYELMTELICLGLRLSFEKGSKEEFEQFQKLVSQAEEKTLANDLDGYNEVSLQCVLLMLETTRNQFLTQDFLQWLPGLRRIYYLSLREDNLNLMDSLFFFKDILGCAATRDAQKAERIVRNYARKEYERVKKIIAAYPFEKDARSQQ